MSYLIDNSYILQVSEHDETKETIILLRQQLDTLSHKRFGDREYGAESKLSLPNCGSNQSEGSSELRSKIGACEETSADERTPTSAMNLNGVLLQEDSMECNPGASLSSLVLMQVPHAIFKKMKFTSKFMFHHILCGRALLASI